MKKTVLRFLSMFCCLMIAGVFFQLPDAKASSTIINSVSVTIREPNPGYGYLSFRASIPSSANYSVADENSGHYSHGVAWHNSNNTYYSEGDFDESYMEFDTGEEYTVEIILTPQSPYMFNASTTGQINGKTASVTYSNGQLILSCTFIVPIKISSPEVVITKPVIGEYPDFHPDVPAGTHYTCTKITWYEDDYTYTLAEGKDTFKDGCYYSAGITLTAETGYAFDAVMGGVNGSWTDMTSCDGKTFYIHFNFGIPAVPPITSAAITITPPAGGAKPSYSPGLPSDAHFYCDNSYPNDTSINDVYWFDETAERWMNTTDTFTAGHVYYFRVDLTPESGYEFDSNFMATVNGNTAETQLRESEDVSYMRLSYTFPALVGSSWVKKDGNWYFYKDGTAVTGWYQDGSKWYYFNSSGVMQSGWIQLGGKWYYLGNEMKTGWQKISNKWYYFNSNGVMQSGWIQLGGKWYYLGNEMKTGWQKISNKWYYFNGDGVMQSGWIQLGGKWYYLGNEMKTGWQKISNKWYYFNSDGVMQTGWIKLGGKWYYLGSEMKTGWQKISNKWYYFDSNGVMQTGWIQLGGKWYYLDNGAMVTGTKVIDGKTYTFDSNGVWTK